ncbi:MAG: hypothetical protein JSU73_03635 [candidate division WOR-3 bacterium]|nr:MAG: hypothetical protein JSU73_03635 [candidate division WOR-3 bacterium]
MSTDGGAAWTSRDLQFRDGGCLLVHPDSVDLVFAGGRGRTSGYPMVVSYSTDAGNTWTRCELSGINSGVARSLAVAPSRSSTIYVGGDVNGSGSVHVSTDFGRTWTETPTAPADSVTGLAVHPEHPDWVYAATRGGLFRTTDVGATWQNMGAGNGLATVRFFPGSSDTLLAGGSPGVLISTDEGQSWTSFNSGLGRARVNCLESAVTDRVMFYAGTEGDACYVYSFPTGIAQRPTGATPGPGVRVWPNLAQARVTAHWPGSPSSSVRVRLWNVSGRLVWSRCAELRKGQLSFGVSGVPTGVYQLELATGPSRARTRLVVSR